MIIHFFTPFDLLEDRVRFVAIVHHPCKEEDPDCGREVDCEKAR